MLSLRRIVKVFNQGTVDESISLNGVNLKLNKGDFVSVIGSNGAGKSTLMNTISGEMIADHGQIIIDGDDVTHAPEFKRAKYIGRVFQDPLAGTAAEMTIEENLAIAFKRNHMRFLSLGVTRARRKFFIEQLQNLNMGLENRLNAKVGLLSGGERQALSLLMATFTQPSILLLDEHTAALDPSRADAITKLTKAIVERFQLTTLMITHNMQQAIDLGNRLIMMDKGEILFEINEKEKKDLSVEKLQMAFREKGQVSP